VAGRRSCAKAKSAAAAAGEPDLGVGVLHMKVSRSPREVELLGDLPEAEPLATTRMLVRGVRETPGPDRPVL
jgi:hypothetical protein